MVVGYVVAGAAVVAAGLAGFRRVQSHQEPQTGPGRLTGQLGDKAANSGAQLYGQIAYKIVDGGKETVELGGRVASASAAAAVDAATLAAVAPARFLQHRLVESESESESGSESQSQAESGSESKSAVNGESKEQDQQSGASGSTSRKASGNGRRTTTRADKSQKRASTPAGKSKKSGSKSEA